MRRRRTWMWIVMLGGGLVAATWMRASIAKAQAAEPRAQTPAAAAAPTTHPATEATTRPAYPRIGASADEPKWPDLLKAQWGLDVRRDLRNPLIDRGAPAALFVRAERGKPVRCTPILALGLTSTTHGGWYRSGPRASEFPRDIASIRRELWAYTYRQSDAERSGPPDHAFTVPPLQSGDVSFDPGDEPFGLWIRNEQFDDGGVFTQPGLVAAVNARLRSQPYKAMIYPYRERGRTVPHSYLIGWEYSTNDDFQDVVTRVDNVRLLSSDPALPGVLKRGATVQKVAGGFTFIEGPAWNDAERALYFSDIPPAHIVRFADGRTTVVNESSRQSNGLMFDKSGSLVRCENKGRRVSRGAPADPGVDVATSDKGKRLNSPNDLWIDADGGLYFTDPRYGARDDLEQDKEAVYYIARDNSLTRVVDDLVRPNGIAMSPDGRSLYVVDNGADSLWRYPVRGPGQLGPGERVADVVQPDGMTVDVRGRLFVTGQDGVWVLEGDGTWIGLIEPPEQPANCTFGGADRRTLFITARTSLYAIETVTRGWHVHLDGPPPR